MADFPSKAYSDSNKGQMSADNSVNTNHVVPAPSGNVSQVSGPNVIAESSTTSLEKKIEDRVVAYKTNANLPLKTNSSDSSGNQVSKNSAKDDNCNTSPSENSNSQIVFNTNTNGGTTVMIERNKVPPEKEKGSQIIINKTNNYRRRREKLKGDDPDQSLNLKVYSSLRANIKEKVDSILAKDDSRSLSFLLEKGIPSGLEFPHGTILHQAIVRGSLRCVHFLLKNHQTHSIPVDSRVKDLYATGLLVSEKSPIELAFKLAFKSKNFKILNALLSYEDVDKGPISNIMDFNKPIDEQGRTALHYAVEQRCTHALRFFLEHSIQEIDVYQKDKTGVSIVDLTRYDLSSVAENSAVDLNMKTLLDTHIIRMDHKRIKEAIIVFFRILSGGNVTIIDPQKNVKMLDPKPKS